MPATPPILFIGTYTRREAHVAGKGQGIYVYTVDTASGALRHLHSVSGPGTVNPTYLALGPGGRTLYAVNEITGDGGHGTVSAFAVDPHSHALAYLNSRPSQGLAPCHLSLTPDGRYCLVANYASGTLSALAVGPDGSLGTATDTVRLTGSGPHPGRQSGPHAHMILPEPTGGRVLAADLGADRLLAFRLDDQRGALIPADPPSIALLPGTGPRHFAFHPTLPLLYLVGELDSTVSAFHASDSPGAFARLQTLSTLPPDWRGNNLPAAIRIAPSGRFVYVSNRGHDSLAIFAADTDTGRLAPVAHVATQGQAPRDFTLDPTGSLLLVANQDADNVVAFRVDSGTGVPHPTGQVAAVPTPVCLLLSSG